jgi:hypothetical protein
MYTTTTGAAKYYAVPTYYREVTPSYYVKQKYYTDAAVNYTTTYATVATRSHNTEVSKYFTEETAYYTTTYAAPVYFTENQSITLLQATTKLRFISTTSARLPTLTYVYVKINITNCLKIVNVVYIYK